MRKRIFVVMSTSVQILQELIAKFDGLTATVQRRSHANNVTWFQFVLDTREDGRLVPKSTSWSKRKKPFRLNVWHVWQATSLEQADGCCVVRLPSEPPEPPDETFAIVIRIESVDQFHQFLRVYQRAEEEIVPTASVPKRGSPPSLIYKAIREVDAFCNGIAEQDAVHVREVLGDVRLVDRRANANIATDGPILHLSIADKE